MIRPASDGVNFEPSGLISYDLLPWLTPAVEYYGDMGPVRHLLGAAKQQHFVVPAVNSNPDLSA